MKKIRCPKCSVINLEGFVTYPNCAGCGAPLPGAAAAGTDATPLFGRNVGPVVWATVLGVAILGLVFVAAKAFEKPPPPPPRIVLMGNVPRVIQTGQVFTATLGIEAMDSRMDEDAEPLHDVRLRIPAELLRRFAFIGVQPGPDRTVHLGSGRYFIYNHLPRGTRLQLKMRALREGPQPFVVSVRELNQTSDEYRTTLNVTPGSAY